MPELLKAGGTQEQFDALRNVTKAVCVPCEALVGCRSQPMPDVLLRPYGE
jgi:hypothetical protein